MILDELDGESTLPHASSSNHHKLVLGHAWKESTATVSSDFILDWQTLNNLNQLILSSSSSPYRHGEDSDLDLRPWFTSMILRTVTYMYIRW